jgi:flagellar basal-body rod protein FlgG
MIRSLWISKTGLDAQQTSMDVITNNLANVSTNGFKRSRPVFEDLLYQTLRQPGAASSQITVIPSGLTLGTGVRVVGTEHIYTQGNLLKTDNPLDRATASSRWRCPTERWPTRETVHSPRTPTARSSPPAAIR